jgi:hypothetical protein
MLVEVVSIDDRRQSNNGRGKATATEECTALHYYLVQHWTVQVLLVQQEAQTAAA